MCSTDDRAASMRAIGEEEGIRPPFIQVDYQVTGRCNARCQFCRCWETSADQRASELPAHVWVDATRRLLEIAPVEPICLGGGEPLLYEPLPELVRGLRQLDLHPVVVTNGLLLDGERGRRLLDAGVSHIDVSIDGFAEVHDELRGVPGLFDRCVRTIDSLLERHPDFSLSLSTMLCARTLEPMPRFVEWITERLPIDGVNFQCYNQVTAYAGPDWWRHDPLWPHDPAIIEDSLSALVTMARSGYRIINDPIHLAKFKSYFLDPRRRLGIRCPAGTFNFSASHTGDIVGCVAMGPVGRIDQDDPLDIVQHRFAAVRHKAASCTENCHFLVNCYFPLRWKRWLEHVHHMVESEGVDQAPASSPCNSSEPGQALMVDVTEPGRLVLPPEVREITSCGPRDCYPPLIRYDDHRHLDLIGTGPANPDQRVPPPGERCELPQVYLCGDSSEVHRWGVELNEDDFFSQVAALEQFCATERKHQIVVGIRRTSFHRLAAIQRLITRHRGADVPIVEPFALTDFVGLRKRFEAYLGRVNSSSAGVGVEYRVVDPLLMEFLESVERAHASGASCSELLRALGPVGKDVFIGPRYLLLDLSGSCNLDCVYCRRFSPWNRDYWRAQNRDLSGFMGLEMVERVLLEAHGLGVETILLVGGGEPTLHPDFGRIAARIHELGMSFNFSTNGSLLHRSMDQLLDSGCNAVTVSLSFASQESFAKIRPQAKPTLKGQIEDNIRALVAARRRRGNSHPKIVALYALCEPNAHEVEDMAAHAIRLGVDTIWYQLVHLEPFSREQLFMDEQRMATVRGQLGAARDIIRGAGLEFHSFIDFELEHYDEQRGDWSRGALLAQGCYVGWHFAFVHLRGEVFLCCGSKVVGMLEQDGSGLTGLWHSEAYRRYRNDGLIMHRENPLTLYGSPLYEAYCESCDNHDQNTMMMESLRGLGLDRYVER